MVKKLFTFIFLIIIIFSNPSFSQNFEMLIPWSDTCANSLDVLENENHASVILSNNYYFNQDTFVFVEGVPTYGSGITVISPVGNILSKRIYYTNGAASWSLFETGRIPGSGIWLENGKMIIPFSQYIGSAPCDSSNSPGAAHSYKIGTVEVGETSNILISKTIYYDDSLCSRTNYAGFGIINDSSFIALESDEWPHTLCVVIRWYNGEVISRSEIDSRYILSFGNARYGTNYKNKVIYQNSDSTFTTLFYDQVEMKSVIATVYPNGSVTSLFPLNVPVQFENVAIKKLDNLFYVLFNEIDTLSTTLTYFGTHLNKYGSDGTLLNTLNIPSMISKSIIIDGHQNSLLLLDKTKDDPDDNMEMPIRICLFDSLLKIKSYHDFGFSYVKPVAISWNNYLTIVGTKLAKTSPSTQKTPSQIYVCRTIIDSINIPWENNLSILPNASNLFSIFPIPAHKSFIIQCNSNKIEIALAQVTDVLGRQVVTLEIDESFQTISTDNFNEAGIYFVNIYTAFGHIERHKIIVMK